MRFDERPFNGFPCSNACWRCTSFGFPRHRHLRFPHRVDFPKFSCDEWPGGRGLGFRRPSCFVRISKALPLAFASSTLPSWHGYNLPCGKSSCFQEPYQVSTFYTVGCAGSGACCWPRSTLTTSRVEWKPYSTSCTFWFKRVNRFRLLHFTVFIADSLMFTPASIPSTYPACDY